MYHAIVRAQLRRAFRNVSRGDYDAVQRVLAADSEHSFSGDHTLGGVRHSEGSRRVWYRRLANVLPGLSFDVLDIAVSGWPWATTAAVRWRDRGRTQTGEPFRNEGVHFLRMRWGRVTSLHIYCDTALLSDVLARQAAAGVTEAAAPPITD
jgi:ketosteroid isomerase-like protein